MKLKSEKDWQRHKSRASDFLDLIAKSSFGEHLISKTVAEGVGEWLMDLKIEQRSSRTIEYYRDYIKAFIKHVGPDANLSSINPTDVRQFLVESQTGPVYAHRGRHASLRAFFNWAKRQKLRLSESSCSMSLRE